LLLVIEKDAILCVWNLFITYKSLTNGFPSVFSSLDIVVKEYICYIRSQVKVGFMVDYTSNSVCVMYSLNTNRLLLQVNTTKYDIPNFKFKQ